MEMLGIPESSIQRHVADVWPEHHRLLPILRSRPWRVAGMGAYIGLDVTQVMSTVQMMGILPGEWPDVLDDLHVIQDTALDLLNGD